MLDEPRHPRYRNLHNTLWPKGFPPSKPLPKLIQKLDETTTGGGSIDKPGNVVTAPDRLAALPDPYAQRRRRRDLQERLL
jgi:hypothetical protein